MAAAASTPVPVSRGEGGPASGTKALSLAPLAFRTPPVAPRLASGAHRYGGARFLLLAAIALGLLFVVTATLPNAALRPALVHEVVVVHRVDFAAVGIGIVFLIGTIYLLGG